MAKAFPDDRYRACLKKGVLEAVQNQRLPIHEYAVTVIDTQDLSGETAPIAYKLAAREAMEGFLINPNGPPPTRQTGP